jgi:hypothetical protein
LLLISKEYYEKTTNLLRKDLQDQDKYKKDLDSVFEGYKKELEEKMKRIKADDEEILRRKRFCFYMVCMFAREFAQLEQLHNLNLCQVARLDETLKIAYQEWKDKSNLHEQTYAEVEQCCKSSIETEKALVLFEEAIKTIRSVAEKGNEERFEEHCTTIKSTMLEYNDRLRDAYFETKFIQHDFENMVRETEKEIKKKKEELKKAPPYKIQTMKQEIQDCEKSISLVTENKNNFGSFEGDLHMKFARIGNFLNLAEQKKTRADDFFICSIAKNNLEDAKLTVTFNGQTIIFSCPISEAAEKIKKKDEEEKEKKKKDLQDELKKYGVTTLQLTEK